MKSTLQICAFLAMAGCMNPSSAKAQTQQAPIKAPIIFLPFDEIKNGSFVNIGSIYAEPVAEGVDLAEGKFGKAAHFSGSASRITIPINLNEAAPYGITVSLWVKLEDGTQYFEYRTLVDCGGKAGFFLRSSSFSGKGPKAIDLNVGATWHAIQVQKGSNLLFPVGAWTHVVATYDSKIARLFVNGELAGEKTLPYTPHYAEAITIGRLAVASPSKDPATGALIQNLAPLDGCIDNLKIYDCALTPEQAMKVDKDGPTL